MAPTPPELRDTEEYVCRHSIEAIHVVNLDGIDRFSTMEISSDPTCDDLAQPDELTFGYACAKVRVDVQDDEILEVEADHQFSTPTHGSNYKHRHRTAKHCDVFCPSSTDRRYLYSHSSASNSGCRRYKRALDLNNKTTHFIFIGTDLDSEREFSYESEFEHNFNTTSNPVTVQGQLKWRVRHE